MGQITIDPEALDRGIQDLEVLAADIESLSAPQVAAPGSGSSVGTACGGSSTDRAMTVLAAELDEVKASLAALVSSSASFFEGVKQTYVSTDQASADAVGGGN